ncbi:MAG TPA: hypothetical protein IGS17_10355 [Oscillatoriales cyanobacterium M59_W2019_021]|nr:hypothetical protein [Oscillatoriales cyanobacterium M4454_W2019_049]HIK51306.1 hypothetical protein [Oscillatoriales cyanobacterium M59_W2019_021]
MIKSNQQGRAWEYAIVEELIRNLPSDKVTLSPRTLQDQLRDRPKYMSLADTLKNRYQPGANCIFRWLEDDFSISSYGIEIDRLSDRSSNQNSKQSKFEV